MVSHPMWLGRFVIVAAVCASPLSAFAQTADESARAEKLFLDAISLVAAGQYAEACPKFEESQRLDSGLGTQFNLALCLEKVGQLGSAWRNFAGVKRLAHETGKEEREEAARQKMDELRPRVPHLVLSSPDVDVTLTVDGQRVERDARTFYAVDTGEHTVEATAPERVTRKLEVTIPAVADGAAGPEIVVEIPALVAKTKTQVVTVTHETSNTKRTIGFAVGGLGVVGIGTAVVTGIGVLTNLANAKEGCTILDPDDRKLKCDAESDRESVSTGKTLIAVNAIAWAVGVAGLGVGSYLVLTSGAKKPTTTAQVTPFVGPGLGGLSVVGRF